MALEGELTKTDDGFEGYIASETIDRDLIVTKNISEERLEESPDFIVYTKSPRGRLIEIGGVWHRISRADNEYLSMSVEIDGRVYNANAFPKKGERVVDAERMDRVKIFADLPQRLRVCHLSLPNRPALFARHPVGFL